MYSLKENSVISLTDIFPDSFDVFTQQQELNEDKTIPKVVIQSAKKIRNNIFVFDRGVQSRKNFNILDNKNCDFVTRINTNSRFKTTSSNQVPSEPINRLKIISDEQGHLFDKQRVNKDNSYRLIKTERLDGKQYWFLTNCNALDIKQVLDIYRKR